MTNDTYLNDSPNTADRSLSRSDAFSLTRAGHLSYWEYDPQAPLRCPSCGWQGPGEGLEELFTGLFDVKCPECECILLVVTYATDEETRLAAAAGNPRANAELVHLGVRSDLSHLREQFELTTSATLPAIDGDSFVIDWDFDDDGLNSWTLLSHESTELWREPAYYEGAQRFRVVARILRSTYGDRLAELRPTEGSRLYLYGDRPSDTAIVSDVNEALRERREF